MASVRKLRKLDTRLHRSAEKIREVRGMYHRDKGAGETKGRWCADKKDSKRTEEKEEHRKGRRKGGVNMKQRWVKTQGKPHTRSRKQKGMDNQDSFYCKHLNSGRKKAELACQNTLFPRNLFRRANRLPPSVPFKLCL